jgi:hypothetical protein
MAVKEIEIVVRGGPGSGAYSAAQATARALEAEGASVDLHTIFTPGELAADALRGVRALVRVESATANTAPSSSGTDSGAPDVGGFGLGNVAKIGIGVVLLLMLFGAELRLNFGLRFDTIVTLAGIWAFWHYCLRTKPTSTLVR